VHLQYWKFSKNRSKCEKRTPLSVQPIRSGFCASPRAGICESGSVRKNSIWAVSGGKFEGPKA